MTQINGFGAYQNTMMNALNQKKKAEADKTTKKAEEQEKLRTKKNDQANKSDKADKTQDKEVQLSDKAKALLEELKQKYGNMDFFIADYSTDEEAQSYLSRGTKEYSVLIDPATLEAMAADEETKTKYTDMIDKATSQIADIKEQLEDEGTEVKRIGITFNDDGSMSMFAELEQISERRREAIEKAHEKKEGRNLWDGILPPDDKVKRTVVTANTVEDLISQIKGVNWDDIEAVDARPAIGSKFDFSL